MDNQKSLLERFEQLNAIGASLSSERNIDRLLENILLAAKAITHADGGTLYRMSEDQLCLRFAIVRTDSLGIAFGGTTGQPIPAHFRDLPLNRDDGAENNSLVAAYSAVHGQTVNIADAYTEAGFDFSGTRKFDEATGYRSKSFLTVPMKNHEHEIIGVLQLINAVDQATGAVREFSLADQQLAESLASQASVALTNRLLVNQLEVLFESFVNLISLAIDEKSPYTGGHCQRVPALTMMLADAVAAEQEGPFADFMLSERDRYELKIASMLHDCGKVTTPVHVVDKATKLETIFDRIQLIDLRFELVRRDAELVCWKAVAGGVERHQAEAEYQAQCLRIDEDRRFIRHINIGGEAMKPEDMARVRDISKRYAWVNPQGDRVDFLSDNEIENLSIRAGTLTQEEREIINHHVVATIRMLESLPWPKHLRHVSEYAGGHHERMDGKGYPKGLRREEMSVQARIMGIADIFEALTARDRPYKPAMKITMALRVLENMAAGGHIDRDLFDVFIREKVYLKYAQQFLADEVGEEGIVA